MAPLTLQSNRLSGFPLPKSLEHPGMPLGRYPGQQKGLGSQPVLLTTES